MKPCMNSRGEEGIGRSNVVLKASSCVSARFGNAPILKALCKLQSKRPMNFQPLRSRRDHRRHVLARLHRIRPPRSSASRPFHCADSDSAEFFGSAYHSIHLDLLRYLSSSSLLRPYLQVCCIFCLSSKYSRSHSFLLIWKHVPILFLSNPPRSLLRVFTRTGIDLSNGHHKPQD